MGRGGTNRSCFIVELFVNSMMMMMMMMTVFGRRMSLFGIFVDRVVVGRIKNLKSGAYHIQATLVCGASCLVATTTTTTTTTLLHYQVKEDILVFGPTDLQ